MAQGQGSRQNNQDSILLTHPQAGVGMVDPKTLAIAGGLSDVMAIAIGVDQIARRVPWYVWLGLGIYGTYWWTKKRG